MAKMGDVSENVRHRPSTTVPRDVDANTNSGDERDCDCGIIKIDRNVINQSDLYSNYKSSNANLSQGSAKKLLSCFGRRHNKKNFLCGCNPLKWIPFLEWFPRYEWRKNLTSDLIAGFTVAVMHIPQGMAYALLANLPPIVGIYMAFFPIIVYTLLGTSRHVSMGTFAVICLMTGKVASEYLTSHNPQPDEVTESPEISREAFLRGFINEPQYTTTESSFPLETIGDDINNTPTYDIVAITTAISFAVGICQFCMGMLRLGTISLLLSPELVSGFTTGAAVHVATSQVKNFLGVSIPRRNGFFKIPLTYWDIGNNITDSNITAVIVSAITILGLVVYNELIKPLASKKIPFPIPIELITIIIGTSVSYFMQMADKYKITILDDIPTGFPTPQIPPMKVIPDIFLDALIISFVAYAVSISMAKIFANKYSYHVDPNQELIAQGTSNVIGSLFSCGPVAASLSRSLIQEFVGGKTQLAGLFSCAILAFVLLWIGPCFESLPNCVLASIIVVALKGMFLQAADLPKIWRECSINGMIWVLTFLSTVILDIEYGLGIGIFISMLTLIWRSNKAHIAILGVYANSDLYVDVNATNNAKEIPGVKIIKYSGSLNFATVEYFVDQVHKIVDKRQISKSRFGKSSTLSPSHSTETIMTTVSPIDDVDENRNIEDPTNTKIPSIVSDNIGIIILDMSSAGSVGPGAVRCLLNLFRSYTKEGIDMIYSGCSVPVLDEMFKCKMMQEVGLNRFFPTVHDAVVHCKSNANQFKGDHIALDAVEE